MPRAPAPPVPTQALPASLGIAKPSFTDVLPIWFPEKDKDNGRDSIVLVHPAVSRWPMTVAGRGHSCGEPRVSGSLTQQFPPKSLDRAVTGAGSAEGSRFRGGRMLPGVA